MNAECIMHKPKNQISFHFFLIHSIVMMLARICFPFAFFPGLVFVIFQRAHRSKVIQNYNMDHFLHRRTDYPVYGCGMNSLFCVKKDSHRQTEWIRIMKFYIYLVKLILQLDRLPWSNMSLFCLPRNMSANVNTRLWKFHDKPKRAMTTRAFSFIIFEQTNLSK